LPARPEQSAKPERLSDLARIRIVQCDPGEGVLCYQSGFVLTAPHPNPLPASGEKEFRLIAVAIEPDVTTILGRLLRIDHAPALR
jgi:hypothetical protein